MMDLEAFRKNASKMSLGQSHSAVHTLFLETLKNKNFSGHILDFGAGLGQLTSSISKLGQFSRIHAVDLFPRPQNLESEIQWTEFDLNLPVPLSKNGFDVIVSSEVIEHLENPRSVARVWFDLLKSGGHLLASTPNNESLRSLLALIFRGHYVDFNDSNYPAHITALLRTDLARILTEAGFVDLEFRYTNRGTLPKLTRQTWQQVSFGLLSGRRFSDNILVIAKKP